MIGNFSIREILEAFRECGIWSSFPGDSRMIREESHVWKQAYVLVYTMLVLYMIHHTFQSLRLTTSNGGVP